jgi:hypothetical protein
MLKILESFHETPGTDFHNSTIRASVNELIEVLGEPSSRTNDSQENVNFVWYCKPDDCNVFTIYDWKEYRTISTDEQIEWHIDGFCKFKTEISADVVESLLKKSRLNKI